MGREDRRSSHHRREQSRVAREGLWPTQIRALPIKMPGSPILVPEEFAHCSEAIRMIGSHNTATNANYAQGLGGRAHLRKFR